MKRVYTSMDIGLISILSELLADHDIPNMIKNEHLSMALGELPADMVSPEIWVHDPRHEARALELIGEFMANQSVVEE